MLQTLADVVMMIGPGDDNGSGLAARGSYRITSSLVDKCKFPMIER